MATLKQVSDQIADALNRPFDDMFKERVKAVFKQELANYIRQQINKHGIDSQFKTRYSTVCKPTSYGDSSLDNSGNHIMTYRSINKVATPVRYNTDDPFTYVGNINGKVPYKYTNISAIEYDNLLPMVKKSYDLEEEGLVVPTRYDYRNGYIYVYFGQPMTFETVNIMIEGVHNTYEFIGDESKDAKDANLTYMDTVEFPMPDDIIQMIKDKLLSGEFSIIDDKDKIESRHIDNN